MRYTLSGCLYVKAPEQNDADTRIWNLNLKLIKCVLDGFGYHTYSLFINPQKYMALFTENMNKVVKKLWQTVAFSENHAPFFNHR
jgi:hypothetical protein